ncbi:MAG: zinc-ribbon domain-containing protein [Synergistaceae bacterium]
MKISWSDFLGIPIQGEVTPETCLAATHPELAKEWDYEKNGDLTPCTITRGSHKKVWWKCKKGHRWEAAINNRVKGRSCPYCSNTSICKDNCLSALNPELAKEWHPTKNGSLTPEDIGSGSSKKVWWICHNGHEWECCVNARSNKGTKCHYCNNQMVHPLKSLKALDPQLSSQWSNKNFPLLPSHVVPRSPKKVWWKCKKGHEWEASIHQRHVKQTGCPYCAGQRATLEKSLFVINPELAKEWDYIKNGDVTPKDVLPNSDKKAWWKCKKGHEWAAVIGARTRGNGCPYCSGHKITENKTFKCIFPKLVKEWDYEKNGGLMPNYVTCGAKTKVYWKCKKGHVWKASVHSRTSLKTGCPYCSGRKIWGLKSFKDSLKLVSDLNFENSKGYVKWARKNGKENGLPICPRNTYKEEWISWNHWLGK